MKAEKEHGSIAQRSSECLFWSVLKGKATQLLETYNATFLFFMSNIFFFLPFLKKIVIVQVQVSAFYSHPNVQHLDIELGYSFGQTLSFKHVN